MTVSFISAITGAALLLAALPTGADDVTWSRCKKGEGGYGRALGSGPDHTATALTLQFCGIKNLDVDAFDGLPNLEIIYLNNNDIENINPAVFSSVPNISSLYMDNNKLQEVPDFGEHSLFPSLERLKLSNNEIVALSNPRTFSACRKLQILILYQNKIQYIHPEFFKPLKNLRELRLENNKIKFITDTMFSIKVLEVLCLNDNLIEYVAPRSFRGSNLAVLHLHNNTIVQLPSDLVFELKNNGGYLKSNIFYFYDNPWHCACLLELLADAKRAGVVMTEWYLPYYTGKQRECVFTGRYPCLRRAPSALLPPPPPPPSTHAGGSLTSCLLLTSSELQ